MLFKGIVKSEDIIKNTPAAEKIVGVKRVKKNQTHTAPVAISMIQGKLRVLLKRKNSLSGIYNFNTMYCGLNLNIYTFLI